MLKHIFLTDLVLKERREALTKNADGLDDFLTEEYIDKFHEKRKRKRTAIDDEIKYFVRQYKDHEDKARVFIADLLSKRQKFFHISNHADNFDNSSDSIYHGLNLRSKLSLAVIGANFYRLYLGRYFPKGYLIDEKNFNPKTQSTNLSPWRWSRYRDSDNRNLENIPAQDKIYYLILTLIVAYFLYDSDIYLNLIFIRYKMGYRTIKIDSECAFDNAFSYETKSTIKKILKFFYTFPINKKAYAQWSRNFPDNRKIYFDHNEDNKCSCESESEIDSENEDTYIPRGIGAQVFNHELLTEGYFTECLNRFVLQKKVFEDIFLDDKSRKHEVMVALALILSQPECQHLKIIDEVLKEEDKDLKQKLIYALGMRLNNFKDAAYEVVPGFKSYFENQDYKKDSLYQEITRKPSQEEKLAYSFFNSKGFSLDRPTPSNYDYDTEKNNEMPIKISEFGFFTMLSNVGLKNKEIESFEIKDLENFSPKIS